MVDYHLTEINNNSRIAITNMITYFMNILVLLLLSMINAKGDTDRLGFYNYFPINFLKKISCYANHFQIISFNNH